MNAITSLGRDDTAPSGFRQFLHCTRITARLLRRIAESIVMAAFIPIWSLVDCLSWMSTTQININGWPAFIRLCFLCLVCAVLASDLPPFKRTRRSSCSLVSTDHPPSIKSNKWVAGGPVGRGKNKPMGRRPAGSALRLGIRQAASARSSCFLHDGQTVPSAHHLHDGNSCSKPVIFQ